MAINFGQSIGEAFVEIRGDFSKLQDDLKLTGMYFQQSAQSIATVGAGLTAAITVPLAGVAAAALNVAGKMEQAGVAFKTMLGGAQAAKEHLDALKQFAASTPFEFPDLVLASKRMQALGFEAKQVIPMLTNVGDAASALGMGNEGMQRIITALGQMQMATKVTAQDMRQLTEAGIPAWQTLAKTLHTDVAGAMDMVHDKAVDASVAIPAILAGMNEKFGGLMKEQSQTLLGQWSNFKDQVTFVLMDLGKVLAPIAKNLLENYLMPLLTWVKDSISWFGKLPSGVQTAALAFAGLAAAAGPLLLALGGTALAINQISMALPAFTASVNLLRNAMAATSVTAVALAGSFAALTVGIGYLVYAYMQMSGAQQLAADTQKRAADSLATYEIRLKQHGVDISDVQKAYREGRLTTDEYIKKLGELRDEFLKLHPVTQAAVTAQGQLSMAVKAVIDEQARAEKGLKSAKEAFDALNNSYKTGTPLANGHVATLAEVNRALADYQKAQSDVNVQVQQHKTKIQEAQAILGINAEKIEGTGKALEVVRQAYIDHKVSLTAYATALDNAAKSSANLGISVMDLWNSMVKAFKPGMVGPIEESQKAIIGVNMAAQSGIPILQAWANVKPPEAKLYKDLVDTIYQVQPVAKGSAAGLALLTAPIMDAVNALGVFGRNLEIDAADAERFGATSIKTWDAIARASENAYARMLRSGEYSEKELTKIALEASMDRVDAERHAGNLTEAEYRERKLYIQAALKELEGDYKTHTEKTATYIRQIQSAFQSVGRAIGDVIVDGGKFGQKMAEVGKQIVKTIVQDIVQYAFGKLLTAIFDASSALGKLGAQLAGVFGGGASAASGAAGAAGSAAGSAGSTAGAVASGASGVVGIVNMVSGIATAISSVVGNFQMHGMNEALNSIDKNTLVTAVETQNFRADAWSREDHLMLKLDDIWNEIRNVVAAIRETAFMVPALAGAGGGGLIETASIPTVSTVEKGGYRSVHITVSGARSPAETARAIADHLRTRSPKFSPLSK